VTRGSTGLDLFKSVKHYHKDGPTIKHVYAIRSDGDLYIGATADLDPATFFSGPFDDVQIFDEALTADEIAEMVE